MLPFLHERKPRQIAAAPFRDRVVHHVLLNSVEPLLDRRFNYDSYACRPGKGVRRAVDRYQDWGRRYAYALKLDVARYFPSIDHEYVCLRVSRSVQQGVHDPFSRLRREGKAE